MPAPYYRFDDVNDGVSITSFPLIAQTSASVGYSIECLFRYSTGSGGYRALFEFGDQATGERRSLVLSGSKLAVSHYGDNHVATTDLVDGQIYHAVSTVSSDGAVTMYLNGVAEAISSGDGTAALTSYSGTTAYIGRTGTGEYFGGEIHHVKVYNLVLSATEVKEFYSGGSVPYKYKGANNYISDFSSGVDNWAAGVGTAAGNIDGIGGQNDNLRHTLTGGSSSSHYLHFNNNSNWYAGKDVRITFDYYIPSGNSAVDSLLFGSYGPATTMNTTDSWTSVDISFNVSQSYGFIIYAADGGVQTVNGDGDVWYIRNFKYWQKGAVAEYDGSGASSDKWFDKSGNDLHGAVSGATVENAPSGEDDGLVYEEGTWTPAFAFPSGTNAEATAGSRGIYTRVGNRVWIDCQIGVGTVNSPSGEFRISGLPFTINDNNETYTQGASPVFHQNYNTGGSDTLVIVRGTGGGTYCRLSYLADNGVATDATPVAATNDTFHFQLSYYV
tara:strand:- start:77 stop:1573 length:1497 start_codon:yes stop_codon:yes gene_type:complete